ncbi:MAG: DUF3147 family protein [Verrucomicrobiota bacterium]|nr:DUF3147 family protein [Verrucomicrobiota bacterium]
MVLYLLKVLISAVVIVAVTELSKRGGTFWGGVLASLPLTSLLAFVWLYAETGDATQIASLSWSILWLVLPSLTLFVALPLFLRRGVSFPWALLVSVFVMVLSYLATVALLKRARS